MAEIKLYGMSVFKNKKNEKYTGKIEGYPISDDKIKIFDIVEDFEDYKGITHKNGKGVIFFNEGDFSHEGVATIDLVLDVKDETDTEEKTQKEVIDYKIINEEWTSLQLKTGEPKEKGKRYNLPVFIETDKEAYEEADNKDEFDSAMNSIGLHRIQEKQEKDYHDGNIVFQSWPTTFKNYVSHFSRDNEVKHYNVIIKTTTKPDGTVLDTRVDRIFEPTFLNGAVELSGTVEEIENMDDFSIVLVKVTKTKTELKQPGFKNIGSFSKSFSVENDNVTFVFSLRVTGDVEVESGDEVNFSLSDDNVSKKKTAIVSLDELKSFDPFA